MPELFAKPSSFPRGLLIYLQALGRYRPRRPDTHTKAQTWSGRKVDPAPGRL